MTNTMNISGITVDIDTIAMSIINGVPSEYDSVVSGIVDTTTHVALWERVLIAQQKLATGARYDLMLEASTSFPSAHMETSYSDEMVDDDIAWDGTEELYDVPDMPDEVDSMALMLDTDDDIEGTIVAKPFDPRYSQVKILNQNLNVLREHKREAQRNIGMLRSGKDREAEQILKDTEYQRDDMVKVDNENATWFADSKGKNIIQRDVQSGYGTRTIDPELQARIHKVSGEIATLKAQYPDGSWDTRTVEQTKLDKSIGYSPKAPWEVRELVLGMLVQQIGAPFLVESQPAEITDAFGHDWSVSSMFEMKRRAENTNDWDKFYRDVSMMRVDRNRDWDPMLEYTISHFEEHDTTPQYVEWTPSGRHNQKGTYASSLLNPDDDVQYAWELDMAYMEVHSTQPRYNGYANTKAWYDTKGLIQLGYNPEKVVSGMLNKLATSKGSYKAFDVVAPYMGMTFIEGMNNGVIIRYGKGVQIAIANDTGKIISRKNETEQWIKLPSKNVRNWVTQWIVAMVAKWNKDIGMTTQQLRQKAAMETQYEPGEIDTNGFNTSFGTVSREMHYRIANGQIVETRRFVETIEGIRRTRVTLYDNNVPKPWIATNTDLNCKSCGGTVVHRTNGVDREFLGCINFQTCKAKQPWANQTIFNKVGMSRYPYGGKVESYVVNEWQEFNGSEKGYYTV